MVDGSAGRGGSPSSAADGFAAGRGSPARIAAASRAAAPGDDDAGASGIAAARGPAAAGRLDVRVHRRGRAGRAGRAPARPCDAVTFRRARLYSFIRFFCFSSSARTARAPSV